MTYWCGSGSGSADPCYWLMDPDPDPGSGSCYFRHLPSKCHHLHHFSKKESQKESQNSRNKDFSYYLCMVVEGSGSIPLTNGSGSGRPKSRWIRIRIRIRIHNTDRKWCRWIDLGNHKHWSFKHTVSYRLLTFSLFQYKIREALKLKNLPQRPLFGPRSVHLCQNLWNLVIQSHSTHERIGNEGSKKR